MRTRLLPFLGLILSGCSTIDMAESWQLDRLRVLAVQAEPAEPQPGETVSFTSLVYLPEGAELEGVVWFACLPEAADDFGCAIDEDLLDGLDPDDASSIDLEALQEAGFIGFEPLLAPEWTAPEDALDGLSDIEAQEGVSALVNLTALPEGAEDDADLELAYKRVPISLAQTPNHNPTVSALLVDGEALDAARLVTTAGATHTIEPVLADGAVETYTYTATDGSEEQREEEPFFTWYAEGGAFDQTFSLYPYSDITWTAPDAPMEGLIVVTVRDRRGGMTWASLPVTVE